MKVLHIIKNVDSQVSNPMWMTNLGWIRRSRSGCFRSGSLFKSLSTSWAQMIPRRSGSKSAKESSISTQTHAAFVSTYPYFAKNTKILLLRIKNCKLCFSGTWLGSLKVICWTRLTNPRVCLRQWCECVKTFTLFWKRILHKYTRHVRAPLWRYSTTASPTRKTNSVSVWYSMSPWQSS